MTNVSSFGKYRHRDEETTMDTSSPLVSLEEGKTISSTLLSGSGINAYSLGVPPKPPRRSSIQIGGIPNGERNNNTTNGKEVNNKRRSSIAILLRRHNDKKDSIPLSKESNENGDNDSSSENSQEQRQRRLSLHEKFRRRKKGQNMGSPLNESLIDHLQVDQPSDGKQCYGSSDDIDVYKLHYIRQKRPSWWNIFIPDNNKPRSRRSSQDVTTLSINSNRAAKGTRSKSRSVDHGLEPPFDVDSLRAKIDKNYDSNDRLSRDGSSKAGSVASIATTTYTVDNRDTLTAVAARYNTTPSELTHINRLGSSFIYPGQVLLVPAPSESTQSSTTSSLTKLKTSKDDLHASDKDIFDGLRPNSPKPGHIERISSPNTKNDDDPVVIQRFLKINVRHITDGQGVVGGVLLVTPNAVMFDPNVSDPLVIEHGPESYGVIAPMELVVNAAIFQDIAHMRVGGGGENKTTETPDVYYPKNCNRYENTHSPGKDSLLVKDETFPELRLGSIEGCDDQESVCSSNEREGDAFPKAFERELVTPTNLQKSHDEQLSTESNDSMTDKTKDNTHAKSTSSYVEVYDAKTVTETPNQTIDLTESIEVEEKKPSADNKITLIDQQWPLPSKECSLDKNQDKDKTQSILAAPIPQIVPQIPSEEISQLIKLSCHDSGIDIRDPNASNILPIQAKKIYTDADVVLSSDWIPPLTVASTYFSDSPPKHTMSIAQTATQTNYVEVGRKKTSSVSFSVEDNECPKSGSIDKMVDSKKNKMLKRLSYPLAWVEGLTGETTKSESTESGPSTGDSSQSVFSKVFSSSPITLVSEFGGNLFLSKTPSEDSGGSPVPPMTPHESQGFSGRSSIGTFIRPHSTDSAQSTNRPRTSGPKLDYRSMVSVDDMPELFVSFDKLIPRPARACPDPPLYLRLRMGRPMGKLQTLPTSVMSYGKNKVRPEYWFSIPKNRVDELYRFLSCWVPHLYGELDEDAINNRGFELIQHDTEWTNGEENKTSTSSTDGDLTDLSRESWELLKAPYAKIYNIIKSQTGSNDLDDCEALSLSTDDYRKATLFATGSFDQEFTIPELIGVTEILTEDHREKLCSHLPARAEGYAWSLIFSTSQHGFSLNTLYRKMQKLETPVLIVIQDTDNNVFGALTSCSLRVSDHFYGTGESLLYKFNPIFKVFHWSGENLYFIKGNQESLAIGSGDGKFGLWLDGDLNQGRSQDCRTYSNEPLAPQEDFVVKTLECWAFV